MDHLLTFAYAAPDALDQDALDRSIVQDVRQNQVFQPIGRLSVKALQNVQQEVRTLLEAAADGQDPIRLRPPIGALSPYLMKPPAGRLPKRLAGQYLQLVSGKWRDVVLAYSCNVISHGGGAGLKRCEVCARAFRAQRSTATLCPRRACKRERNSQAWKEVGHREGQGETTQTTRGTLLPYGLATARCARGARCQEGT